MFKFSKYICIFFLILAAPFVFKPNAALAGGGFTASCNNMRLLNNANWMEADCSNNAQQVVRATVYLNGSITNNNGTLASYILLNDEDLELLLQNKSRFTKFLENTKQELDYQPHPVQVYSPDPHYTASGLNDSSNNGEIFANDARTAYNMALSYLLTKDTRYAATAQRIIDSWAVTLHYITTLQGKDNINFNAAFMILAADWTKNASGWNSKQFDDFLRTVVLPNNLTTDPGNRGMWAVLMEASAAAYFGDMNQLRQAEDRWQEILEGEVASDGTMPSEMQRSGTTDWQGGADKGSKGIAYTHYTLLPATVAAKIFSNYGLDAFSTKGGKLLSSAFALVAQWTLHPESFPFYQSNNGQLVGIRNAAYFPLLLKFYPNRDAEEVVRQGNLGMDGFYLSEIFGK